ncbi:hypothetical protein HYN24_09090 [Dechloromonas sp. HYN0024]|nr:hypothetical protein HYN24_09090 [Dechloromonas sp. HYN0024]
MHKLKKGRCSMRWESEIIAERLARYDPVPKRYGHLVCHNGRLVDGMAMYPLPLRTRLTLWLRKLMPKFNTTAKHPPRLSG